MGHDWTQIYLYVAGKTVKRHEKREVPADILVETLDRDQERDLAHLKRWIYDTRVKHRKTIAREERREAKERKESEPTLQMAFDLGLNS